MCIPTVTIFISLGYCVFISQGIISMTYIVQVGVRKVAACFLNFHVLVPTMFGEKKTPAFLAMAREPKPVTVPFFVHHIQN